MNINSLPDEETTEKEGIKRTNAVVLYHSFRFVRLNWIEENETSKLDPNTDFLLVANQYNNTKNTTRPNQCRIAFSVRFALHFGKARAGSPRTCKFATIRKIHILYPNIKSHRSTGDHYLSTSTSTHLLLFFYSAVRVSLFFGCRKKEKFIHRHQTQPKHNNNGRRWRQSTKKNRRWSEDKHGIATVQSTSPLKHFGTRERESWSKKIGAPRTHKDKS